MVPVNIVYAAKSMALGSLHRFRVGAVVYKGNKIIGWGYNKADKTHPKSFHPYKSIHAEFDAVLEAVWKLGLKLDSRLGPFLDDYSIYVHRLKKDGSDGLAKPCQWCQKMLDQVGIKEIYYSND